MIMTFADWRSDVEKLLRLSPTLLVYQDVLTTKPAEAFLACLQHIYDRNPDLAQQQFAVMARAVQRSAPSWADYIQDQILLGKDNPFAQSCEREGAAWDHRLREAAAYDVQTLQALAVSEEQLVSWIQACCAHGTPAEMRVWAYAAAAGATFHLFVQRVTVVQQTAQQRSHIQCRQAAPYHCQTR